MDNDIIDKMLSVAGNAIITDIALAYFVPMLRKTLDERTRDIMGVVTKDDEKRLEKLAAYEISTETKYPQLPHLCGYGKMDSFDEQLFMRSRKNKNLAEELERQKAVLRAIVSRRKPYIQI